MDNFEEHVKENRTLFDEHRPDKDKLWANIEAELDKAEPKVIPLWKLPLVRIAASILLLLGISGIIGISTFENTKGKESMYVSKDLRDIDMHYRSLVSYQVQLVKNNTRLSEEDKTDFLSFMDDLDDEYRILKLEMGKNLDNQQVLEAIIANYKKRIELIENLLKQINESKIADDDYGYTL